MNITSQQQLTNFVLKDLQNDVNKQETWRFGITKTDQIVVVKKTDSIWSKINFSIQSFFGRIGTSAMRFEAFKSKYFVTLALSVEKEQNVCAAMLHTLQDQKKEVEAQRIKYEAETSQMQAKLLQLETQIVKASQELKETQTSLQMSNQQLSKTKQLGSTLSKKNQALQSEHKALLAMQPANEQLKNTLTKQLKVLEGLANQFKTHFPDVIDFDKSDKELKTLRLRLVNLSNAIMFGVTQWETKYVTHRQPALKNTKQVILNLKAFAQQIEFHLNNESRLSTERLHDELSLIFSSLVHFMNKYLNEQNEQDKELLEVLYVALEGFKGNP